ncbi:MAG: preprotein translocase subunit YajC [Acidimicrobiia bacterium]
MDGILLLVILGVMWAVLLVPQQRRARKARELVASLTVGDEVMTTAGIYGKITGEDDGDLFLEISPGIEIRIARGAIANRVEFEDDFETDFENDDASSPDFDDSESADGVD